MMSAPPMMAATHSSQPQLDWDSEFSRVADTDVKGKGKAVVSDVVDLEARFKELSATEDGMGKHPDYMSDFEKYVDHFSTPVDTDVPVQSMEPNEDRRPHRSLRTSKMGVRVSAGPSSSAGGDRRSKGRQPGLCRRSHACMGATIWEGVG